MSYENLDLAFKVFQFLLTCGVGIYAWVATKHRATREEIAEVRRGSNERLQGHADRLTRLEEGAKHLPTTEAMNMLSARLGELHGDFKALYSEVQGMRDSFQIMRNQLQVVDNYLREHGAPRS